MDDEIEAFQRRHAILLKHGDLDALVRLYRTSLPVFSTKGLKVDATRNELRKAFAGIVAWIDGAGVHRSEVEVLKIERKKGTSTIAVTNRIRYFDGKNQCIGTTVIRHFLEKTPSDDFVIIMVDCKELAFETASKPNGAALFH